jgi:hypothetical protein
MNDAVKDPFAAFDPGPPPAPNLTSQGVIATDITSQFVNAAQRMDLQPTVLNHVLIDHRARGWAAGEGPLLHIV